MPLSAKVNRAEFLAACKRANEATGVRNIKPVLQCVLIESDNSLLTVRGTNLEQEVIADCKAVIESPGSVITDAESLCKALAVIGEDEVTLEVDEPNLEVSTPLSQYKFRLQVEQFPRLDFSTTGQSFKIKQARLAEALVWTTFCVSMYDADGWSINGLLMEVADDGFLYFVGVGRHDMAVYRTEIKSETKGKYILPKETFKLLRGLISSIGSEEEINIGVDSSKILFSCGRSSVGSRLMEGRPPPWVFFTKTAYTHFATLPSAAIGSLIAQASVVLDYPYINCDIDVSDGEISISAHGARGDTHVESPCEISGGNFSFRCGLEEFGTMLSTVDVEKATINFSLKSSVLCVSFDGRDDYKFYRARGEDAKSEPATA